MKILELQLKKNVLIFQPDERGNINSWIALHSKKWNFICLGLELTEEIASELVELTIMHLTYGGNKHKYRSYVNYTLGFDNALESFISAVESKKFHWLENPIGNKPMSYNLPLYKIGNRCDNLKKWQEAEEKTFKNPLIFVKK